MKRLRTYKCKNEAVKGKGGVKNLGKTGELIYEQPLNLASWGYIHLAQAAGFGCIISSEF